MKKIAMAVALSTFIAVPAVAAGNAYIGINAGTNQTAYDNVGSSIGYGVFGGYSFNEFVAAELSYVSLSDADITGSTSKLSGSVVALAAVGSLPLGRDFSLTGKAGYASSSVSSGGTSSSKADLTFGIGAQYNIGKKFGVRLNYDRFNVGEGANGWDTKSSTFISLGALFKM